MMAAIYTLKQLAEILGAKLRGDPMRVIKGIAPLPRATAEQISFLSDSQYQAHLATTQAGAVILSAQDAARCQADVLILDNPYLGYAKVAALFQEIPQCSPGIHPTAVVGAHCQIDATASIGAYCVLSDNVIVGAGSMLGAGCSIGENSRIGKNCQIAARVSIYHQVTIGDRVCIHSGAVIGSDGFGMANDKGVWHKIPQLGRVVIGNDVEIGANTTIDRGALEDTIIEEGVKLDNLIQIAHNVKVGAHTAIAAGVLIGGSAKIGKRCMIGGGTTIVSHVEIADGVIFVGTSVVGHAVSKADVYGSGTGLVPFKELKRLMVRFRQLDEMAKRLQLLERKEK